jgi:methylmalonyl-CoA mutase
MAETTTERTMNAHPAPAPRRATATHPRFVTAASLFDGHDASINIMRRILQAEGVEVIHLGHDRSVEEIATAAIEEDAHAIAVSSYQGGHCEFFSYLVKLLAERGRPDILVFGGGGGTITDREIVWLHEQGVARIYSVEDGRRLGLVGMIRDMIERARRDLLDDTAVIPEGVSFSAPAQVARALTLVEALADIGESPTPELLAQRDAVFASLHEQRRGLAMPVVGITGPGGAGKSSLTDELVRRFVDTWPERRVAVLSVDPSRRKTGGALLGDRIRMNAVFDPRVFMRSMATRRANTSISAALSAAVDVFALAGFDMVLLETAGIGQSGSEISDFADVSLYVMTPEYGAPSQLEKIDMLDFADVVAVNKADKQGAQDAVRYVAKQVQRNRAAFDTPVEKMPVYMCCDLRSQGRRLERGRITMGCAGQTWHSPRGARPVPERDR